MGRESFAIRCEKTYRKEVIRKYNKDNDVALFCDAIRKYNQKNT